MLTQTIKAWLTNDQFEIPNETTNPFHDRVLNAFQTQAGIGYDNLMRGLLAKEWRTLMDEWYRHTIASVKHNGIRWQKYLIRKLLEFGHEMWVERCTIVSAATNISHENRVRKQAWVGCIELKRE